jgi:hypothetical protein
MADYFYYYTGAYTLNIVAYSSHHRREDCSAFYVCPTAFPPTYQTISSPIGSPTASRTGYIATPPQTLQRHPTFKSLPIARATLRVGIFSSDIGTTIRVPAARIRARQAFTISPRVKCPKEIGLSVHRPAAGSTHRRSQLRRADRSNCERDPRKLN